MIFSRIANKVLMNTTLFAKGERVKGASIFPFFNQSGQVKQLMLLLPDTKEVYILPFKRKIVSVSPLGVIRFSMDLAKLKSHANFTHEQIARLYHYDPNWLLSHERFAAYWAKKLIKASNCAAYIKQRVHCLIFTRDLSSLEHIVIQSGYLNLFRIISPDVLLQTMPRTQSDISELSIKPRHGGWQLEPVWHDWSDI